MKKLIFISILLIVGCEEPTEPVDNSIRGYVKDSQGNVLSNAAIIFQYYFPQYEHIYEDSLTRSMPVTMMSINIENDSTHVNIWVETLCGNTVIVLTDSIYNKGAHTIIWYATGATEGLYIVHMVTPEESISQNIMLTILDEDQFNYQFVNGVLGLLMSYNMLQEDTLYNAQGYYVMTNSDGYFSAPLNCLPFGIEQIGMDEFGNPADNWSLPYKTRLWIAHVGDSTFSTDWYDVDPNNGIELNITAPY